VTADGADAELGEGSVDMDACAAAAGEAGAEWLVYERVHIDASLAEFRVLPVTGHVAHVDDRATPLDLVEPPDRIVAGRVHPADVDLELEFPGALDELIERDSVPEGPELGVVVVVLQF